MNKSIKEKKISLRFFLRKNLKPIDFCFMGITSGKCYHLCVEVIHRRKVNSSFSLFYLFLDNGRVKNPSYNSEFLGFKKSYVEEQIFNSIESYINNDFQIIPTEDHFIQKLTSFVNIENGVKTVPNFFINILQHEYEHLYYMVKKSGESIESERFTLSNLNEAYLHSLQFISTYYDNYLIEKLMLKFYELDKRIPVDSIDTSKSFIHIVEIVNRFANIITTANSQEFVKFSMTLLKIQAYIERYYCNTEENKYGPYGLTLPIWSYKIKERDLVSEIKMILGPNTDSSILDLTEDMALTVRKRLIYEEEKMVIFFK